MSEYKCPHCNQTIYDEEALNCLYCGEGLGRNTGFLSQLRIPRPRLIGALIAGMIIVSFILLILR